MYIITRMYVFAKITECLSKYLFQRAKKTGFLKKIVAFRVFFFNF